MCRTTFAKGDLQGLLTMPQALNDFSEEQSNPSIAMAEDMLLGCGSLHDGQAGNAEVNAGDSEIHHDVLSIEAEILKPDTTPAQNHSITGTKQYPGGFPHEAAQRFPFTAMHLDFIGSGGLPADSSRLPAKATVAESQDRQTNGRKEGSTASTNGFEEDNWSMMVERSQEITTQVCKSDKLGRHEVENAKTGP